MARKKKFKLPRVRSLGGSWSMEPVNARMRTPCKLCKCRITDGLRIKLVADAYPYPETLIFCPRCARRAIWRAVKSIKTDVRAFCQYLPPKTEQAVQPARSVV